MKERKKNPWKYTNVYMFGGENGIEPKDGQKSLKRS
jgi:hypothetical protein